MKETRPEKTAAAQTAQHWDTAFCKYKQRSQQFLLSRQTANPKVRFTLELLNSSFEFFFLNFGKSLQKKTQGTGKSLSEALLLSEHGENKLCTKIVLNVKNNFFTQHVLPMFWAWNFHVSIELVIQWTVCRHIVG